MNIFDRIIRSGYRIQSTNELLSIVHNTPAEELYEGCHRVTQNCCGEGFDTCSIINVKSGKCPEDCKWCAQSAHYKTGCDTYDIIEATKCANQAAHNKKLGIKRFSLVASGRRPSKKDTEKYALIYEAIRNQVDIACCASLGLADEEALRKLYQAGVTTYHCNLETAPSFFHSLCTTHTQADKIKTLRAARKVGMRVCSGGILGMGESWEQRAEFALFLQSLGIESIPLNFLHPIAGTPLGNRNAMPATEMLQCVAMFRLANPSAFLRFSGGRDLFDTETQKKALYIGINSAITGDLLTTVASVTTQDMQLFTECGYNTQKETSWEQ